MALVIYIIFAAPDNSLLCALLVAVTLSSQVLCTTIAEALAMGKFVICASHPSNDFFTQFPNCLPYSNKEEFVGNLCYALSHDPEPFKGENAAMLSWEAATERLAEAAMVTEEERDRWLEEDEVAVKMPSLVRNKVMRKEIHEGLINTRTRYRKFKSRLAAELDSPRNPLPPPLKSKLRAELERKLDVDFEKVRKLLTSKRGPQKRDAKRERCRAKRAAKEEVVAANPIASNLMLPSSTLPSQLLREPELRLCKGQVV